MINKKVSEYTSINNSYKNVNLQKWKLVRILKMFFSPPIIAHLASIVALASVYFSVRGWEWSYKIVGDWIVPIACIILFLVGIKVLYKKEIKMFVSYNELHDLLTVARYEAEDSIVNIGGDISWLRCDMESLRKIKKEHNNIKIRIYYDKNKLSKETKSVMEMLRKENTVNLIPYPEGIKPPNIRCMITDYDYTEKENCKIFIYSRIDGNGMSRHKDDKFEWQENTIKTNPELYEIITAFLQTLEKSEGHQIKVGVSGLNNTGKTSIISECVKILSQTFKVVVVPDTFEVVPKNKNIREINKQIIFTQIVDMCTYYDADIIFYDRTPFDNFIYMLMREAEYSISPKYRIEQIKSEYDYLIESLMDCFDLKFFVQRKINTEKCRTKYISPKERKYLLELYDKYSKEYLPDIDHVFEIRGKEFFAEDVQKSAMKMCEKIQDYYYH